MFSRSLCCGRFAGCALRALNVACSERSAFRQSRLSVSPCLRSALATLVEALTVTPVRTIKVTYSQPLVLLTDGAHEIALTGAVGTIGGLLLLPHMKLAFYFAGVITSTFLVGLAGVSQNPIGQVELVAVLVALHLWESELQSRAMIGFVDNEAAKHALVRGLSAQATMAALCDVACSAEIRQGASWFWERVPSESNGADAPSRGAPPLAPPGGLSQSELAYRVSS